MLFLLTRRWAGAVLRLVARYWGKMQGEFAGLPEYFHQSRVSPV
jgi:hypothetical protein